MDGGDNNEEITTVNNIPDTNPNEGNTSTTGNISNMWGGEYIEYDWKHLYVN